eukprot:m51a1_g5011 hypothetical protein (216) ;mRNA; f:261248-262435
MKAPESSGATSAAATTAATLLRTVRLPSGVLPVEEVRVACAARADSTSVGAFLDNVSRALRDAAAASPSASAAPRITVDRVLVEDDAGQWTPVPSHNVLSSLSLPEADFELVLLRDSPEPAGSSPSPAQAHFAQFQHVKKVSCHRMCPQCLDRHFGRKDLREPCPVCRNECTCDRCRARLPKILAAMGAAAGIVAAAAPAPRVAQPPPSLAPLDF